MEISRKNPVLALNVISRIHQLSADYLKTELERAGATGLVSSHGHILGCLYTEDHLPMRRIAEMIKRRKSTLTVLADKLEQEGYIQRDVSPDDSRVRYISLTTKGRAVQKEFEGISGALQERVWYGFSPEEQVKAMEFLARMEANFQHGQNGFTVEKGDTVATEAEGMAGKENSRREPVRRGKKEDVVHV